MVSCIQNYAGFPAMYKLVMSTWDYRKDFASAKWSAYHKTRKLQLPPLELQIISKSQLQMCPEVWAHKFHPSIGELKDVTKRSYKQNYLSSLVSNYQKSPLLETLSQPKYFNMERMLQTWFHACIKKSGIRLKLFWGGFLSPMLSLNWETEASAWHDS